MTDLASLVVRLEADIGTYQANLEKANKQLKAFTDSANSLLGDLAGAVAGFFTVDKLEEWGKSLLEQADHMYKFAQSVGDSVEDLSRLQFAMTSSGVAGEQLSVVFKTLNDNLSTAAGNATSKAGLAFQILGVSVKNADGSVRDASSTLSAIADKFAGMQDGANKTALAVELFGRQGATLIPFLNQGSAGIQQFKDKADALGVTLDTATAKSAEDFSIKLGEMKAQLTGIGNTVLAALLPNLNELADSFTNTAQGAQSLAEISSVVTTFVKIIADAGLTAAKTFDDLGNIFGAIGAQVNALVHGNLSEVANIQKALEEEIADSDTAFQKRLDAIWRDGGDAVLNEVKVTATKMKAQAPSLAMAEAAAEAQKTLTKLRDTIAAQVATFGLGEGELLKYRLTVGDLAKDVTNAGAKGKQLAAGIEAQAAALQKLKDTKVITEALQGINAEIAKLSGNTADAAVDELDKKYTQFITDARRTGNQAALDMYNRLVTLTAATGDFNAETKKSSDIESGLAQTEQLLGDARDKGNITDLQMQQQLDVAYGKTADSLQKIYNQQVLIAQQTGNPEQLAAVQKLGTQIDVLRTKADSAGQAIRKGFEDDLTGPLTDLETHTKSLGEAFDELLGNLEKQLLDLANKQLVQSLLGGIGDSTSNGSGGNIYSSIASLFTGGGHAMGGGVNPGTAYPVNENLPGQSEWFVPGVPGNIVPAQGMGGGLTVNQNIVVEAPKGTVSRSTLMQTGAAAASQLQRSNQRNN